MKSPTLPFVALGWAAIVASGLIAAAVARHPAEYLVWMVAYLVLIAGAAQVALGKGLAKLPDQTPSAGMIWGSWILLNMGHAGIISGTLAGTFPLVAAATVLYLIAVVWLGAAVRPGTHKAGLNWYRTLIVVLFVSALIGATLSWHAH